MIIQSTRVYIASTFTKAQVEIEEKRLSESILTTQNL